MQTAVTMSRKNQIVVPREAREKLHLLPGQQLLVLSKDDRIVLIPRPKNFTEKMSGLHKEVWQGINTEDYLAEERDGWRK
jgi:AbrB family looped-hinge helix DNA binding protein